MLEQLTMLCSSSLEEASSMTAPKSAPHPHPKTTCRQLPRRNSKFVKLPSSGVTGWGRSRFGQSNEHIHLAFLLERGAQEEAEEEEEEDEDEDEEEAAPRKENAAT